MQTPSKHIPSDNWASSVLVVVLFWATMFILYFSFLGAADRAPLLLKSSAGAGYLFNESQSTGIYVNPRSTSFPLGLDIITAIYLLLVPTVLTYTLYKVKSRNRITSSTVIGAIHMTLLIIGFWLWPGIGIEGWTLFTIPPVPALYIAYQVFSVLILSYVYQGEILPRNRERQTIEVHIEFQWKLIQILLTLTVISIISIFVPFAINYLQSSFFGLLYLISTLISVPVSAILFLSLKLINYYRYLLLF